MPDQAEEDFGRFVVPQFIDVEDKIFGPITVRQFVIMLVAAGIAFIFFKLFDFALFLLTGIPMVGIGLITAFLRINGQPFHFFLLNLMQTLKRPRLRVWNKELSASEVRELAIVKEETPPPPPPSKPPLEASRLSELALVVNTGGVYKPEA